MQIFEHRTCRLYLYSRSYAYHKLQGHLLVQYLLATAFVMSQVSVSSITQRRRAHRLFSPILYILDRRRLSLIMMQQQHLHHRQLLPRPPFVDPTTNIIYDTDQPDYEGWLTKQSMWLKVCVGDFGSCQAPFSWVVVCFYSCRRFSFYIIIMIRTGVVVTFYLNGASCSLPNRNTRLRTA
jgi:hypothetical protein